MLTPRFGALTLAEAQALLSGLQAVDQVQLAQGWPSVSLGLQTGRLRYLRRDPNEHWRNVREIWRFGGGDCEDLAAAVAAELIMQGVPARAVIQRVRPGLAHALVRLPDRRIIDPSRTGGMRAA